MRTCVVGLGYIGLPTALMLAANGVDVEAVDYNLEIVNQLRNGKITFEEDGLDELYKVAVNANINFRTDYPQSDLYVVAVPTPYIKESKQVDPSYIIKAVQEILKVCHENSILVIESTISPGTIDKNIRPMIDSSKKKIHLAHAPERIIPGNMIYELVNNSRTIGCDSTVIGEQIKSLYKSFCKGEIILTDIRTAEMSKVVENTFRDINIAFANELAKICRRGGMDVYEVIRIANKHPRVNILQPGPGVGGHCISVDPWFLVGDYPDLTKLIYQARTINSEMPEYVLERIKMIMDEHDISDFSRVGLYGLTYKENIDDIRESPTLQLLDIIKRQNLSLPIVYDPMIKNICVERQVKDFEQFKASADMIVILVGHTHIIENYNEISDKIILDTRNIFNDVYKL